MLKPTKHSHPDKTVLGVCSILIERLKKRRIESFDDLRTFVSKKVEGGELLFVPALSFLFIMGVVEYHKKTDSFEFLINNEA